MYKLSRIVPVRMSATYPTFGVGGSTHVKTTWFQWRGHTWGMQARAI